MREQGNAAPGAFQPRCRRSRYGAAAQAAPRGDHGQLAAMLKFMPAGFPKHTRLCAAKTAIAKCPFRNRLLRPLHNRFRLRQDRVSAF